MYNDPAQWIIWIFIALYMLPGIIAMLRGCDHWGAIAVLNLCTGWSILGWLFCLIWACVGYNSRRMVYMDPPVYYGPPPGYVPYGPPPGPYPPYPPFQAQGYPPPGYNAGPGYPPPPGQAYQDDPRMHRARWPWR